MKIITAIKTKTNVSDQSESNRITHGDLICAFSEFSERNGEQVNLSSRIAQEHLARFVLDRVKGNGVNHG